LGLPQRRKIMMFLEPIIDKLRELRLHGMLQQVEQLQQHPGTAQIDAMDMFGMLVDAEQTYRENNKLAARLRRAAFKYKNAALEDVIYRPGRGFAKTRITELMSSRWVATHKNVLLIGATGAGKSWLACALGNKACRDGYTVLYKRTTRLLEELAAERAIGKYAAALKVLARAEVLILDDFCMMKMTASERRDLHEILEERYGQASTVVSSQLEPGQWHTAIDDATFSDSICDRLAHGAHRLNMQGESMRKVLAESAPQSVKEQSDRENGQAPQRSGPELN
jgi:DNA replication protein DnaC